MNTDTGSRGEATVPIRVTDLDRGIAWHRDMPGFALEHRLDDLGWCRLAAGIGGLHVGRARFGARSPCQAAASLRAPRLQRTEPGLDGAGAGRLRSGRSHGRSA